MQVVKESDPRAQDMVVTWLPELAHYYSIRLVYTTTTGEDLTTHKQCGVVKA